MSTAGFYRAMVQSKLGNAAEAQRLLAQADAMVVPPPPRYGEIPVGSADPDLLILWLASREAKALLGSSTTNQP